MPNKDFYKARKEIKDPECSLLAVPADGSINIDGTVNRKVLQTLNKLYKWLTSFSCGCPDIEIDTFQDYVKNSSKEDKPLLQDIFNQFDNPKSSCPDICIGDLIDECCKRAGIILCADKPFTDIEKEIIGKICFNPKSLDCLIWEFNCVYNQEQIIEGVKQLIENNYVYDNGKLHVVINQLKEFL